MTAYNDPLRPETMPLHVSMRFPDHATMQRASHEMSEYLTKHGDASCRIDPQGDRAAVMHVKMPDRSAATSKHVHNHATFIQFIKHLVGSYDGQVTHVMDSTINNDGEPACTGPALMRKPNHDPALNAFLRAKKRKDQVEQGATMSAEKPTKKWRITIHKVGDVMNYADVIAVASDPKTKEAVGRGDFADEGDKKLYPQSIFVKEEFRRQGVASAIYSELKAQGYVILAGAQTEDGQAFRAQFDGKIDQGQVKRALIAAGVAVTLIGGFLVLQHAIPKVFDIATKVLVKFGGKWIKVKRAPKPMAFDFDIPVAGQTITKRQIAVAIADELGIAQQRSLNVVKATLDKLAQALLNGQRVELRNFGVFEMRRRKGRLRANPPNSGHPNTVTHHPEVLYVHFRPSKRIHEPRTGVYPGRRSGGEQRREQRERQGRERYKERYFSYELGHRRGSVSLSPGHDGHKKRGLVIDVPRLNELCKDNEVTEKLVADLTKRVARTKRTGFSKDRMSKVNMDQPIILDENDYVLDGRHRLLRAETESLDHIKCRVATREQIQQCVKRGTNRSDTSAKRHIVASYAMGMFHRQWRNRSTDGSTGEIGNEYSPNSEGDQHIARATPKTLKNMKSWSFRFRDADTAWNFCEYGVGDLEDDYYPNLVPEEVHKEFYSVMHQFRRSGKTVTCSVPLSGILREWLTMKARAERAAIQRNYDKRKKRRFSHVSMDYLPDVQSQGVHGYHRSEARVISPMQMPPQQETPEHAESTEMNLYFEGEDLADEASLWLRQNGCQVRRPFEHSHRMTVTGSRRAVNTCVQKFKGSPIRRPRPSEAMKIGSQSVDNVGQDGQITGAGKSARLRRPPQQGMGFASEERKYGYGWFKFRSPKTAQRVGLALQALGVTLMAVQVGIIGVKLKDAHDRAQLQKAKDLIKESGGVQISEAKVKSSGQQGQMSDDSMRGCAFAFFKKPHVWRSAHRKAKYERKQTQERGQRRYIALIIASQLGAAATVLTSYFVGLGMLGRGISKIFKVADRTYVEGTSQEAIDKYMIEARKKGLVVKQIKADDLRKEAKDTMKDTAASMASDTNKSEKQRSVERAEKKIKNKYVKGQEKEHSERFGVAEAVTQTAAGVGAYFAIRFWGHIPIMRLSKMFMELGIRAVYALQSLGKRMHRSARPSPGQAGQQVQGVKVWLTPEQYSRLKPVVNSAGGEIKKLTGPAMSHGRTVAMGATDVMNFVFNISDSAMTAAAVAWLAAEGYSVHKRGRSIVATATEDAVKSVKQVKDYLKSRYHAVINVADAINKASETINKTHGKVRSVVDAPADIGYTALQGAKKTVRVVRAIPGAARDTYRQQGVKGFIPRTGKQGALAATVVFVSAAAATAAYQLMKKVCGSVSLQGDKIVARPKDQAEQQNVEQIAKAAKGRIMAASFGVADRDWFKRPKKQGFGQKIKSVGSKINSAVVRAWHSHPLAPTAMIIGATTVIPAFVRWLSSKFVGVNKEPYEHLKHTDPIEYYRLTAQYCRDTAAKNGDGPKGTEKHDAYLEALRFANHFEKLHKEALKSTKRAQMSHLVPRHRREFTIASFAGNDPIMDWEYRCGSTSKAKQAWNELHRRGFGSPQIDQQGAKLRILGITHMQAMDLFYDLQQMEFGVNTPPTGKPSHYTGPGSQHNVGHMPGQQYQESPYDQYQPSGYGGPGSQQSMFRGRNDLEPYRDKGVQRDFDPSRVNDQKNGAQKPLKDELIEAVLAFGSGAVALRVIEWLSRAGIFQVGDDGHGQLYVRVKSVAMRLLQAVASAFRGKILKTRPVSASKSFVIPPGFLKAGAAAKPTSAKKPAAPAAPKKTRTKKPVLPTLPPPTMRMKPDTERKPRKRKKKGEFSLGHDYDVSLALPALIAGVGGYFGRRMLWEGAKKLGWWIIKDVSPYVATMVVSDLVASGILAEVKHGEVVVKTDDPVKAEKIAKRRAKAAKVQKVARDTVASYDMAMEPFGGRRDVHADAKHAAEFVKKHFKKGVMAVYMTVAFAANAYLLGKFIKDVSDSGSKAVTKPDGKVTVLTTDPELIRRIAQECKASSIQVQAS